MELQISGVGSDRSSNYTTTAAQSSIILALQVIFHFII